MHTSRVTPGRHGATITVQYLEWVVVVLVDLFERLAINPSRVSMDLTRQLMVYCQETHSTIAGVAYPVPPRLNFHTDELTMIYDSGLISTLVIAWRTLCVCWRGQQRCGLVHFRKPKTS